MQNVMLDTLQEFLDLHSENDYFYWWWFNTLTHDKYEHAVFADDLYLKFFKDNFAQGMLMNGGSRYCWRRRVGCLKF